MIPIHALNRAAQSSVEPLASALKLAAAISCSVGLTRRGCRASLWSRPGSSPRGPGCLIHPQCGNHLCRHAAPAGANGAGDPGYRGRGVLPGSGGHGGRVCGTQAEGWPFLVLLGFADHVVASHGRLALRVSDSNPTGVASPWGIRSNVSHDCGTSDRDSQRVRAANQSQKS
jgi:hypothetical protein